MAFLPFNNNPFQVNGDDTSYTVPAGRYAIIYPKMDSTSDLEVNGDVYYNANLIQQDQVIVSGGGATTFEYTVPNYGVWSCFIYISSPGAGNLTATDFEKVDPRGAPIETIAFLNPGGSDLTSPEFELRYGQKIDISSNASAGSHTLRFRASRVDVQPTHSFWVPAGTTITGKFNYAEYITP